MSDTSRPSVSIILVHGAWADGSSWRKVIPILQERGLEVIAVQNPTSSLAADVEATNLALASVPGPVVLAGHSWGGTVITEAGDDAKVKALVYVAAFAPSEGESTGDQVGAHAPPPALSGISDDGSGRLRMSADSWIENVAQDLPASDARTLAAIAPPLGPSTFSDRVTKAAWAQKASWYVVSAADRAVSVDLQRDLAKRLKASTTELEASHMSLLSKPEAVAEVILEAARFAESA